MRQRRSHYLPSSSHNLAKMVTDLTGPRSATRIKRHLESESLRPRVANLAGPAGAEWVISQLITSPFVVVGWPNPCKAARMTMRKAARR